MSVQIKAYLHEGRPCRSKEIRRFSIDHDVLTNYEYFRRKVASIFPNIGDNFALQWRDSDGDFVWFNSDEELLQALGQHSGEEFKIYIKEENLTGNVNFQRCGPRFCGPRFAPYQVPFGFIHQDFFKNCPLFAGANVKQTKEGANEPSTSKTDDKQSREGVDVEYLQQMGKAVAEFLHPFGINVDINVEKQKSDSESPNTSKPSAPPPPTTASSASEQSAASTSKKAPSSSESTSSQWTIINNDEKSDKTPEDKSKVAEDEMEVDEVSRLREALDRLLGMGFNDQGGWLTNLLKASDCDIGRALDAMQPNRSRKN